MHIRTPAVLRAALAAAGLAAAAGAAAQADLILTNGKIATMAKDGRPSPSGTARSLPPAATRRC